MSVKVSSYIWDGCAAEGIKGNKLLIMARLADFSNDEGVSYPGIDTISRQTGAGRSTVITLIGELERDGWLTKKERRNGQRNTSNLYTLNIARLRKAASRYYSDSPESERTDSECSTSERSASVRSKSERSEKVKKRGSHSPESGPDPSVNSKPDPSDKKPSRPVAPQPDGGEQSDDFSSRHPEAFVYSAAKRQWGSQADLTCAEFIWSKIIAMYELAAESDEEVVRPKEPNWITWANEVRLMVVQDGRTHKQICSLFKRANRDAFWCRNILSPSKLREKWDELSLKLSPSLGAGSARDDRAFKPTYASVDYSEIPAGFRG
ncbi:helix-turn-helix domain-containing protein [Klebsiella sp. PL-2018]|uniref:helix-turn-helix domain-containing protein n=1 Tax=Klebsiella sp. PL-2018 TaxID=2851540 RepID=UPI001C2363FE|nr:helix-turn-helix domain-containing protein [Klebsiella sp. PL-2018]QXC99346.1 Primosomal protein I [Klebsiella sp. PL-2018]